jgi:hypothetical protein
MFTTELPVNNKSAPAPYRREFYLTVLIMGFTMAQIWAFMVVLVFMRPSGPALLAMALTLTGATIAVVNGWRHILRRSRDHVDHLSRI